MIILATPAGKTTAPLQLCIESNSQETPDNLPKLLKRPVVIGQISMGYLPPTLRLSPVAVMNDAENPILQVGSAEAPLDWAALVHLRLSPKEVDVTRWSLTVLRKSDGTWDIEDWLPGATGLSGAPSWPLQRIHWKEGEIHWMDRYANAPQELVLSAIEGQWDPRPEILESQGVFSGMVSGVRLTLNAKGKFFSNPQWSADVELADQGNQAAFHCVKSSEALEIKGQSLRWRLATALSFLKFYGRASVASVDTASPLMLENSQVHTKMAKSHSTFEFSDGISGGLSEVKGTLDAQAVGPLLRADIAMRDVPVEAIWNLAGEKIPLDGKVTVVAKGFQAVICSSMSSTVAGEAYIELKEGRYRLPDVSIKKLARAKTIAYVKKKVPRLYVKGIPVTKMSAHLKAKGGAARVDDGFLSAADIRAAWVGKIDLARQGLDGFLRLQIHEKDPALAGFFPAKYKTQPAFGRLQGTWQEWLLWSVPPTKIPAAAQSNLRKAIH